MTYFLNKNGSKKSKWKLKFFSKQTKWKYDFCKLMFRKNSNKREVVSSKCLQQKKEKKRKE
jgi:hypothetical protein